MISKPLMAALALATIVSAGGTASPTPARAQDGVETEMIGYHQLCQ